MKKDQIIKTLEQLPSSDYASWHQIAPSSMSQKVLAQYDINLDINVNSICKPLIRNCEKINDYQGGLQIAQFIMLVHESLINNKHTLWDTKDIMQANLDATPLTNEQLINKLKNHKRGDYND